MLNEEHNALIGSPLNATPWELNYLARNYRRWYPSMMDGNGWGHFLKVKYSLQCTGLGTLVERFLQRKKYSEHDRHKHHQYVETLVSEICHRAFYQHQFSRHVRFDGDSVGDEYWNDGEPNPYREYYDEEHDIHRWSAWIDGKHTQMTAMDYAKRYLDKHAQRKINLRITEGERYKKRNDAYAAKAAVLNEKYLRKEWLREKFEQEHAA